MQIFLLAFYLFGSFAVLTGCSSFEKWQTGNQEQRQFDVKRVWIRETLQKENLYFRKISRFSPIFYKSPNGSEIVIQGNGVDGVVAIGREKGELIWRLPIRNGVEAGAVLQNDRLYFGANDGFFYCVDASTGKMIWNFPTRIENLSDPLLDNGVVYFLSGANSVYALSAETGRQLWLYSRQDPSNLTIRGGSKPSIKSGTLYVGFSDGALVALIASNGTIKWEKKLNRNKKFRDLDSQPLVDNEVVYVLGYDDHTYCLRAATGDLVWKNTFGGYGDILKIEDRLYYATTSEEFVSVFADTGKKVWSYKLRDGIATSPTFLKGLIVFGESQGAVRFFEPGSGRFVGAFDPGSGVHGMPKIDEKNGMVYFLSNESNLYALKIGWKYPSDISYLK